jgi:hypothetical protein
MDSGNEPIIGVEHPRPQPTYWASQFPNSLQFTDLKNKHTKKANNYKGGMLYRFKK